MIVPWTDTLITKGTLPYSVLCDCLMYHNNKENEVDAILRFSMNLGANGLG